MKEFVESPLHEHMESPLHERVYSTAPPKLEWQVLMQREVWPGIRPFKIGSINPITQGGGWYDVYDSIDNLRDARRRYKTKTTDWSGLAFDMPTFSYVPVSYQEISTLSGSGLSPTSTGGPAGFDNLGWPYGTQDKYNIKPPHGVHIGPINDVVDSVDRLARVWNDGDLSEALSDEVDHRPILTGMLDRLAGRDWSDVLATWDYKRTEFRDQWAAEAYQVSHYYTNTPVVDPATFDGAYYLTAMATTTDWLDEVWFFQSQIPEILSKPGSGYQPLCSYWVYPEYADLYNARHATLYPPAEIRLMARRFRFRLKNVVLPTNYFIAWSLIRATPESSGTFRSVRLHHTAKVISSGTITDSTPLEVPLPYVDGHPAFSDFCQLGSYLSCGAVAFCIFDETPDEWSTRTGINIAPTADDPLWTADDDTMTVDQIP